MSNYQLAETSFNILKLESWERLLKFYGISIIVGIAVCLVIYLIISVVGSESVPLALLLVLGVVLMGQSYALSWYEYWRGCNFQVAN